MSAVFMTFRSFLLQLCGLCLLLLSFLPSIKAQQLSYDSLLQHTMLHHPLMKAEDAVIQQRVLQEAQQGVWSDPQLQMGIGVLPIETRLGAQQMRIGLQQAIPQIGALRMEEQLSRAQKESAEWLKMEQALQLRLELEQLLIRYVYAQQTLEEVEELLYWTKAEVNWLKEALGSDLAPLDRYLASQQELSSWEAEAQSLSVELKFLAQDIRALTQADGKFTVDLDAFLSDQTSFQTPASVGLSHPSMAFYEAQKNAKNQEIALSELKKRPSLVLGFDYWMIQQRSDMQIANSGRDVFIPTIGLKLPIRRKVYQAAVKQRKKALEETAYRQQSKKLAIERLLEAEQTKNEQLQIALSSLEEQQQWIMDRLGLAIKAQSSSDNRAKELSLRKALAQNALEQHTKRREQALSWSRLRYASAHDLQRIRALIQEHLYQNRP